MRGLKFLFNSWIRWKWSVVLAAAMFVGISVTACVFRTGLGDIDYLMAVAFLQLAPYGVLTIAMITGFLNINGYKLIRSSPIAKELYTRSVPVFIISLSLGSSIIANGIYFIVLAVQGASAEYFSDTLIFMAISGGLNILSFSLLSRMMFGGLVGIYLNMLPYIAAVLAMDENAKFNGFGLPVWVSALIFAGAVIVSSAVSFIVCGIFFRKLNFKQPAANYAAK